MTGAKVIEAVILSPRADSRGAIVSAVVNFHREGGVARATLDGLVRVRRHAEAAGILVEMIFVLDRADDETTAIVLQHPLVQSCDLVLKVQCGDLGLARNIGFAAARGEFSCNFDGDDLFSANWITAALHRATQAGKPAVVHPQLVVNFDRIQSVCRLIDQSDGRFADAALLKTHPWIANGLAPASLYRDVPYQQAGVAEGFGYEDWHWNLEVMAHGFVHVTAPETAIFYRRKAESMLTSYVASKVVIRPSRFFEDIAWTKSARPTAKPPTSKGHASTGRA